MARKCRKEGLQDPGSVLSGWQDVDLSDQMTIDCCTFLVTTKLDIYLLS